MEHKSTNGNGKASWRDRLGIGKEIPKISGEFQTKPVEPKLSPQPKVPPPRGSQPIAKPAPMAPRSGPPVKSPAASGRPAITPQTKPDPLAERLKTQRAAAERLAEQRVMSARDKAAPAAPMPAPVANAMPKLSNERPKFTFVDEEPAPANNQPAPTAAKREFTPSTVPPKPAPSAALTPPPIVPPRPALGGTPPLGQRPGLAPYQPQFTPPQPQAYRSLDPPGFQPLTRPAVPPVRPFTPPAYGAELATGEQRTAVRPAYEPPRRPPVPENRADDAAIRPKPGPARARKSDAEDDLGDVFEDDPPPRRRASAQDYTRAHREYEDEYAEQGARRSRGPLMLLLALIVAAALAGGGVWYYNVMIKPQTAATTKGEVVPVVEAPAAPAKIEPEPVVPAATGTGEPATPAVRTKQIYDRIVGDRAIEGDQMVPTEEPPAQAPAPQSGVAAEPIPEPAGTAQPVDQDTGLGIADTPEEEKPLPLPPPPGGTETQGLLPEPARQVSERPAAALPAAVTPAGGMPTPAEKTIAALAPPVEQMAPVPGETNAAPAVDPAPAAVPELPPPVAEEPAEAVPVEIVKPSKPKTKAAKVKRKPKPAATATAALGSEPVILVPPAGRDVVVIGSVPDARSGNARRPIAGRRADSTRVPESAGPTVANFKGGSKTKPAADDQVASIAEAATARESGGRYLVQLGSFRSEAVARAEMERLRAKNGPLAAVSTRVTKSRFAGIPRYRIVSSGVGSRAEANRDLRVAAGAERAQLQCEAALGDALRARVVGHFELMARQLGVVSPQLPLLLAGRTGVGDVPHEETRG